MYILDVIEASEQTKIAKRAKAVIQCVVVTLPGFCNRFLKGCFVKNANKSKDTTPGMFTGSEVGCQVKDMWVDLQSPLIGHNRLCTYRIELPQLRRVMQLVFRRCSCCIPKSMEF